MIKRFSKIDFENNYQTYCTITILNFQKDQKP